MHGLSGVGSLTTEGAQEREEVLQIVRLALMIPPHTDRHTYHQSVCTRAQGRMLLALARGVQSSPRSASAWAGRKEGLWSVAVDRKNE